MKRSDRDALKRALVLARTLDAQIARIVDTNLKTLPWQEAAEHAAYLCQMRLLKLRPWQTPPMMSHEEVDPQGRYGGTIEEVGLRRRMISHGLSLNDPDPMRALSEGRGEGGC